MKSKVSQLPKVDSHTASHASSPLNPDLTLAEAAYDTGDYEEALANYREFLISADEHADSSVLATVFHHAGNAALKLKRNNEALELYYSVLDIENYAERSQVLVNVGRVLIKLGKPQEAIDCLQSVLNDPSFGKKYLVQLWLGNAYFSLNDYANAGESYRASALDPANVKSEKALINLGFCFIRMGRQQDAIASLLPVLEVSTDPVVLGKVNELLGICYGQQHKWSLAVDAFNNAKKYQNDSLSSEAAVMYDEATAALSGVVLQDDLELDKADFDETADQALQNLSEYGAGNPEDSINFTDMGSDNFVITDEMTGQVPSLNDTNFFEVPEKQLVKEGKIDAKVERKTNKFRLKLAAVIVIVLVILTGIAALLYWQGFGWPTVEAQVSGVFHNRANNQSTVDFWLLDQNRTEAEVNKIMQDVPQSNSYVIDYQNAGPNSAESRVKLNLPTGGHVYYTVQLERDIIAWKVTNLYLSFASTQSG